MEMMKSVLAKVPMPVLLIGPGERILTANQLASEIFGPDIEGRHYMTILRQPAVLEAVERTLRSGVQSVTRIILSGISRDTVYRAHSAPVLLDQGGGALVSLEDITDLEQATQSRRDFVANVSHELRTPLTALLGFIQTLTGAARDDAVARNRFLGIMEREAERMNRLVGDLLSLSRVEAEARVRPTERIDLVALVRSAVDPLRSLASEQGVEITVETDGLGLGVEELIVHADPDQLTQVVTNLVENAVKYGGSGKGVQVALRLNPRDLDMRVPAVTVAVTDHGDGIDPLHLPRLTERFYRVDSHRSREKGGTGLGLAIVKHIMNRHRGMLRIKSDRGVGSCFSISLRLP